MAWDRSLPPSDRVGGEEDPVGDHNADTTALAEVRAKLGDLPDASVGSVFRWDGSKLVEVVPSDTSARMALVWNPDTGRWEPSSATAVRAYLGSAQSVPGSTWTKVAVDTATDDPSSLFDSANNQVDVDKGGWWLVSVGVGFDGSSTGDRRMAAIAHNGARTARSVSPPAGASVFTVTVSDIVKATSGDTFEAHTWQDSGGSLGLRAQEGDTWLSAVFLGPA